MQPLVFTPFLRPLVWGNRRLATHLGKQLPAEGSFGEAWEISAHASHVVVVAEGPLAGISLTDLCMRHADALFGEQPPQAVFPLLVKYLDAHDWLSVQVHPDDRLARELSPGEMGKTEAWIILHADPGARVWAGLRDGVSRADLEQHLREGTVVECLHSFEPRPGDCVFLPAGTVHAVGGGVLLAEVQQTSDATYRLFDWNRVQPDGSRRPLHIEQSLASINWQAGPVSPVVPRPLPGQPDGAVGETLVRCRYFHLDRFTLTAPLEVPPRRRLSIWLIVAGSVILRGQDGYERHFHRGETTLIPADAPALTWTPTGASTTLLRVQLPDRVAADLASMSRAS
jgi:mannose-6-phosphate isomerase